MAPNSGRVLLGFALIETGGEQGYMVYGTRCHRIHILKIGLLEELRHG